MAYTWFCDVDNSEISKAINGVSAWDGRARLNIEAALKKGVKDIAADAKSKINSRTGNLKKGIKTSFKPATLTGYVKSMAPHSHLIENGVKSAITLPKNAKALHIVDARLVRFVAHSTIPARAGRPFMKTAYDENMPDIVNGVKRAVNKA